MLKFMRPVSKEEQAAADAAEFQAIRNKRLQQELPVLEAKAPSERAENISKRKREQAEFRKQAEQELGDKVLVDKA